MALIKSDHTKTLVPPHEPESWFNVRPIRAGDFESMTSDGQVVRLSLDLLAQLVQSWSYPDPITRETVAELDPDTYLWLCNEIMGVSGIRDSAEKKDSNSTSTSSLLLESELSPSSLVTS